MARQQNFPDVGLALDRIKSLHERMLKVVEHERLLIYDKAYYRAKQKEYTLHQGHSPITRSYNESKVQLKTDFSFILPITITASRPNLVETFKRKNMSFHQTHDFAYERYINRSYDTGTRSFVSTDG